MPLDGTLPHLPVTCGTPIDASCGIYCLLQHFPGEENIFQMGEFQPFPSNGPHQSLSLLDFSYEP